MEKNPPQIDRSINLPGSVGKYGAKLFRPKEIIKKPDTSTSIEVEWKNTKKLSPQVPVKEDLNIIYKNSIITDGENKGQKLDLHMNIMYHPDSEKPTDIILFIPGGGFFLVILIHHYY